MKLLYAALIFFLIFPARAMAATQPLQLAEEEMQRGQFEWPWNKYKAFREELSDKYGTGLAFLINADYQYILHSRQHEGQNTAVWYWNLEVSQKLWKGATLFTEFEVDRGKGADKYIPCLSVFNTNTGRNLNLYIPRVYLEQDIPEKHLFLTGGKLDLSDWFDANYAAESGDTQFLSDSLINNLAIPFPAKGLGFMARVDISNLFYFQSGAATARATSTKVGLDDGFNSLFFINELGFTPEIKGLSGNYRFMLHFEHEKFDTFSDPDIVKRGQVGFAVSFDQFITRRINLFARYGFADRKVREIEHFCSCGAQINEPLPGRKNDYIGIGYALSLISSDYRAYNGPDTASTESFYEAYYNFYVNPSISLTPHLQVVIHPDADKTINSNAVCGMRVLVTF